MTQIIQIHMILRPLLAKCEILIYFFLKYLSFPSDLMFLYDSQNERIQIDHQFAKMKKFSSKKNYLFFHLKSCLYDLNHTIN